MDRAVTNRSRTILKESHRKQIDEEYSKCLSRYDECFATMLIKIETLKVPNALLYAKEGVCRRMLILKVCVENIYSIYPTSRMQILSAKEMLDVNIQMHAFYVNISGLLDNLAWIRVYENGMENSIDRRKIGLFSNKLTPLFDTRFSQYLSGNIANWHSVFIKDYRDALAHRFPLYLPAYEFVADTGQIRPTVLVSQNSMAGKAFVLHAQLLADLNTIEEIVRMYYEYELETV